MSDSRPTLLGLASNITMALPSGFLALLLVNCLFLGLMAWRDNTQQAIRAELIGKIIEACVLKGATQ